MSCLLIVNADDFGRSPGINRGIIEAHERGIVTSASLMVRYPASHAATEYARAHPRLSVGLHIDLCEWVCRSSDWQQVYEVAPTSDGAAVAREVKRQVEWFRTSMGREPTHLDSHQHVHRDEPVQSVLLDLGRRLGVPVRHFAAGLNFCGDFFGQTARGDSWPQGITIEHLIATLKALPDGWVELACHPGTGADYESSYQSKRSLELVALCDPRVRAALDESSIELRSFIDCPCGA